MTAEHSESRREFLRAVGRGGAFGVLGVLGFLLGRKSAAVSRSAHECTGQGYCRGCVRHDDCGLPAALSARARTSEGSMPHE